MSKKKRKIEIPTDEEIRAYAGSATGTTGRRQDEPAGDASEPKSEEGREPQSQANGAEAKPSLQEQLDAVQKELDELKDKLLRAKADTQNLLRRTAIEKSDAIRFANEGFVKALLPVVDDFERTLDAAQQTGSSDSISEGVQLIYDILQKVLRDHHVTVIEAEGKPFDPRMHNAAMQQPCDDHEPGTVLRELQRGYCLHERVVRPAQVVLSASPSNEANTGPSPQEEKS